MADQAAQEIPLHQLAFFPLMFNIINSTDQTDQTDQQTERIMLLNPFTQSMVILHGSAPSSGPAPASKSSIDALKTVTLQENYQSDQSECVVCLDGLFERESECNLVKEMPCKHRFHGECIEKWLSVNGSCPVCRFCMPKEEEREERKSEEGRMNGIWVSVLFGGLNEDQDDSS